jgi:ATP-dependent Lon protease
VTTPKEKFETKKLPMMPIRDVVIFPYMMTPFVVGRESSVHALEEALAGDKKIFWLPSTTPRSTNRSRARFIRSERSSISCRA